MSCLHTISKGPGQDLLEQCLQVVSPGDAILLIEDAVYYCLQQTLPSTLPGGVSLHALREDMQARGLLERNAADLDTVNYQEFVELCCDIDKTLSWF